MACLVTVWLRTVDCVNNIRKQIGAALGASDLEVFTTLRKMKASF